MGQIDIAATTAVVGAGDKGDQEDHQAANAQLQYAVPWVLFHFLDKVVHRYDSLITRAFYCRGMPFERPDSNLSILISIEPVID